MLHHLLLSPSSLYFVVPPSYPLKSYPFKKYYFHLGNPLPRCLKNFNGYWFGGHGSDFLARPLAPYRYLTDLNLKLCLDPLSPCCLGFYRS